MQKFYVNGDGVCLGSIADATEEPPEGWIEVPYGPENSDQVWQFPDGPYGPSRSAAVNLETEWRDGELTVIARQLEAIEEAAAAAEEGEDPPADLLPGTRNKWLSYRTKVSAWKETNTAFPFGDRPVRPA
ncbi:hypothetical protein [Pseudomonas sp. GV071]|jgi:hypothetical protein|uniref:hypothetical protein n=1 Tax=Pseudomonas sp. GV071 TaxID=2135754 RepID=UPI000D394D51|nr:hypothetical protein [Pseudomonas sp. GV071]PTQ70340.1 hypothetical protein C8K61_10662 [Pseudomonas sp. GV071]